MAKRLETPNAPEANASFEDVFQKNQSLIGIIAGVLILVIGGYYAYQNFIYQPKVEAGAEALVEAQKKFAQDSFQVALANPGNGNLGFLDIMSDYSGTPAANTANYYAGVSYLNIGKYDAAIAHLNDFSTEDAALKIMKLGVTGDAYSEKEDFGQALSFYNKAIDAAKNEELQSYYLLKVGMLQEKLEKFDEAKKAFVRIKQDFPESSFASDIDKYISKVDASSN